MPRKREYLFSHKIIRKQKIKIIYLGTMHSSNYCAWINGHIYEWGNRLLSFKIKSP